ncbi:hypothetical protein H671_6g17072 [Cricetulus griseus]|uniref:Uncharacterized protein n=1 Tax=Cricetulus griseus TaxID=10029 RepID=A0A061I0W1_CRIGR|nr:hypothetical protein H671_6g17072 [Cricetulus griseus]
MREALKLYCRRIRMSCVVLAGETIAWDIWCQNPGNQDLIIVSTIGDPLATRQIQNCRVVNSERTSRTILKRYGESGQPYLVPNFRGIALSFSPFNLMLAVWFLYIAFIMLRGYRSI